MKTLYMECYAGISGDMVLGAFLDLGVDEQYLKMELAKFRSDGYELEVEKIQKKGIAGTICHVRVREEQKHRHFAHIRDMIKQSALEQKVKDTAIAIFTRVAKGESRVHGVDVEQVHFHEVGSLASIIDIVGAAICYHKIAPEQMLVSGINVGSGWINCAHGILPVPAPAVVEIMADTDIPMYSKHIEEECATPTGVAIAAELARHTPQMPELKLEKVAYGYGTKEFPQINGLRMMLGETAKKEENIVVLEANMDDMTGEMAGYALEKLMEAGARDAFYTPIYMKKNRPAIMLKVIADAGNVKEMEKIILKETSTIGLRKYQVQRTRMDRTSEEIETIYGKVRVKISRFEDLERKTLEYEDVKKIAECTGKGMMELMKELNKYI